MLQALRSSPGPVHLINGDSNTQPVVRAQQRVLIEWCLQCNYHLIMLRFTWPSVSIKSNLVTLSDGRLPMGQVISSVYDCVSVCIHALKGNWLELPTPKLGWHAVHGILSACIDLEAKRSRSNSYQMRCQCGYVCQQDWLIF